MNFSLLLIILLLFSSCKEQATDKDPIKVGIIDGGLCLNLHPMKEGEKLTYWGPPPLNCPTELENFDRSLHGSHVFSNIFRNRQEWLNGPLTVEFVNIYDQQGEQSLERWKMALERMEKFQPHLIVMAVGASWKWAEELKFPNGIPVIAATPTWMGRIAPENAYLWPTKARMEQVIQVGLAIKEHKSLTQKDSQSRANQAVLSPAIGPTKGYFDTGQDQNGSIDYFLWRTDERTGFKGTSLATARFAKAALQFCKDALISRSMAKFGHCLDSHTSALDLKVAPKSGKKLGSYYKLFNIGVK